MNCDSSHVVDGRIAADLPCHRCGYNLRTLGTDARCPECNFPVYDTLQKLTRGRPARSLNPAFARAAIIQAGLGLACILGFRMILAVNDLRLMDLWLEARRHPTPTAILFARAGLALAYVLACMAAAAIVYSLYVLVVSGLRRDGKSVRRTLLALLLTLLYGYLAVECGFIIAGV
ncbi:MAG: hypothetical protein JSU68_05020 [Phycisphaerales bacterium]|nr:MAG: hypothetical protein JSU68_05020 [Phycisphaerales bacterium]